VSRPPLAALAARLAPLLVALGAALPFLPALEGEWLLWDDDMNFLGNLDWRGLGLAHVGWMLTSFHAGHWIPLAWLTLGLDHALWGMDARGYHLTNLAIHAATAAAVYALGRRLLASPAAAAGAALLFAIHPLRVESVAWITERRDVLSGLLVVLTVLAYLRAVSGRAPAAAHRGWLAGALGLFALACLAKSMAVTVPLVLLVLDAWPLRRLGRTALLEKTPFLLVSLAVGAIAVLAVRVGARFTGLHDLGPLDRVALSLHSLAFYLWKTVAPVGLTPLYEMPRPFEPWAWPFVLSALAVAALAAAIVALRHRSPALAAAGLAYVVILLPVGGLAHNGPQLAADRYTYVASIPLALLAGAALARWPRPLLAASLPVLAFLGLLTWQQAHAWRDTESLWMHAIAVAPSSTAHYNLSILRQREGRWAEVLAHAGEALRLRPEAAEPLDSMGVALDALGRLGEAEATLREALRRDPGLFAAWSNLGAVVARQGRMEEAVGMFRQALALNPGYVNAHANLALALRALGREAEARPHAEMAERFGFQLPR
jgi:tetratricopeptide (TPR) repeat protein